MYFELSLSVNLFTGTPDHCETMPAISSKPTEGQLSSLFSFAVIYSLYFLLTSESSSRILAALSKSCVKAA